MPPTPPRSQRSDATRSATVSAATGFDWKSYWTGRTSLVPEPVPPELDYDLWLGPAPFKPYNPHRVHGTFRGYCRGIRSRQPTWIRSGSVMRGFAATILATVVRPWSRVDRTIALNVSPRSTR